MLFFSFLIIYFLLFLFLLFCIYLYFAWVFKTTSTLLVHVFWSLSITPLLPMWSWSCGSWMYNYLCNQYILPLMLRVRISIKPRYAALCDKVCRWLVTGRWFSLGFPVSSTNKNDSHDITEILLKVALNTIKQTNKTLVTVP